MRRRSSSRLSRILAERRGIDFLAFIVDGKRKWIGLPQNGNGSRHGFDGLDGVVG